MGKIDIRLLKNAFLKVPIHAAKRLFKPLLVLLVLLILFGLYLLLHRTSPPSSSTSPPSKYFANNKYHEKLQKILKPSLNEGNIKKDSINTVDKPIEVKIPKFIKKHIELKKPIEKDGENHKAKPSDKHKRIFKRKQHQIKDIKKVKKSISFIFTSNLLYLSLDQKLSKVL